MITNKDKLDNIELINLIRDTLNEFAVHSVIRCNNIYTFKYLSSIVLFALSNDNKGLTFYAYDEIIFDQLNIKDIDALKQDEIMYMKLKNELNYYELKYINAGNIIDSIKSMMYILNGIDILYK